VNRDCADDVDDVRTDRHRFAFLFSIGGKELFGESTP
jgi:hypothetical protein